MASAANPLLAGGGINPQMLMALLAARGKTGAAGAAMGTGSPGDSVSPAARELQAADPDYALKLISDIKKKVADMIPTLAFRAPAAARSLAATFKGLDAAIKELQQAQATLQAVGGPMNLSAIPRPQPPGGTGAPSEGLPRTLPMAA